MDQRANESCQGEKGDSACWLQNAKSHDDKNKQLQFDVAPGSSLEKKTHFSVRQSSMSCHVTTVSHHVKTPCLSDKSFASNFSGFRDCSKLL